MGDALLHAILVSAQGPISTALSDNRYDRSACKPPRQHIQVDVVGKFVTLCN